MMLPVPDCPLEEQSELGQQRDRLPVRFIPALMAEKAEEIQSGSRLAVLLETVNNTSLTKHPSLRLLATGDVCLLRAWSIIH